MSHPLFGTQLIERILLFLFVNGQGYGTQLHHALGIALTPIQKALNRLEQGGVITSFYQGKTRVYQFHPGYPLANELEQFLKKTYTLLPGQERKLYYYPREERALARKQTFNKAKVLTAFWGKLKKISRLSFNSTSKAKDTTGWEGRGTGKVSIAHQDPTLIFHEKGVWKDKQGNEVHFSNSFRWSLDRSNNVISLEHLRRGVDQPVFLFHLTPTGKQILSSIDSHLCEGDTYFGQVHFDETTLRLNWRIIGPKKNEEIDYYYA